MSYPVLEVADRLRESLHNNRIVILQAPPGAGKSTILPLHLLDEPWLRGKKIIMLEPRRLAARSVAQRMASLRKEKTGETIGYRIRFESSVRDSTRIEVVTEGLFLRMIQDDSTLSEVGMVIFDEFHERSLAADLSVALTLDVRKVLREDLRILLMSATLDGEKIQSAVGESDIITSTGKQYPVSMLYQPNDTVSNMIDQVCRTIRRALREQKGDVLVFLPGAGEIRRVQATLETDALGAECFPLYGELPFDKQQEAILPHPAGARKVVLATSIAETSLTIEGITTVIDSGLARVPRFDPASGFTRLETIKVTKDAADQRAGRAGRLGPGVCYRLWSEGTQLHLVPNRNPEILDADLAPLVLELSQWGVKNVSDINWITPPPRGAIHQAIQLLSQLDALHNGVITDRGRKMVRLPTHPRIAHMLTAVDTDTRMLTLAIDVASLLEERDPLSKEAGVDLTLRIETLRRWRSGERVSADVRALERIERVAANWCRLLHVKPSAAMVSDEEVGLLLMLAYPERIARQTARHSERYKLANGRMALLPKADPLHHYTWLVLASLDAGREEGRIFLAAPVDEKDLHRYAQEARTTRWDDERNMVVAQVEKRVGNLVLESKPSASMPDDERIRVLCQQVRDKGLKVIGWDDATDQWQARVMSLRTWRKDEPWPDVSTHHLLDTLEEWLPPFLTNITRQAELERLDSMTIMQSLVPWALQSRIDTLAPLRIPVPSGSMIQLQYNQEGSPPVLQVRLQEIFGLLETPVINEGRNKVMIHLLSPGYKPVQITQDLHSFWQNTYHEVRKELRMRYPKHYWPEDPWTAEAVRGVRRKGG